MFGSCLIPFLNICILIVCCANNNDNTILLILWYKILHLIFFQKHLNSLAKLPTLDDVHCVLLLKIYIKNSIFINLDHKVGSVIIQANFSYFNKLNRVTLVNKILTIASIQFYSISSVYCTVYSFEIVLSTSMPSILHGWHLKKE